MFLFDVGGVSGKGPIPGQKQVAQAGQNQPKQVEPKKAEKDTFVIRSTQKVDDALIKGITSKDPKVIIESAKILREAAKADPKIQQYLDSLEKNPLVVETKFPVDKLIADTEKKLVDLATNNKENSSDLVLLLAALRAAKGAGVSTITNKDEFKPSDLFKKSEIILQPFQPGNSGKITYPLVDPA
jgi:hypothetical protein